MKTRFVIAAAVIAMALNSLPNSTVIAQTKQGPKQNTRSAKADLKMEAFQQNGDAKNKNGKLEVPFIMSIKNIGSVASKDNLVNGIRISNQYRWSGFMESLAPGQIRVVNGVLKIDPPSSTHPNRDLHLIAMTDAPIAAADTSVPAWGREQESNERNNTKALGVAIPSKIGGLTTGGNSGSASGNGNLIGKPTPNAGGGVGGGGSGPVDLVMEKFELRGQVKYQNGKIHIPIRMQIRNAGGLPSPENLANGVSIGGEYKWVGLMKSVVSGGTRVITGTVKIPDAGKLKRGRTLKLTAMADAPIAAADTSIPKWGRVQESNEMNNKRVLNVKVPGELDLVKTQAGSPSDSNKPPAKSKANSTQKKRSRFSKKR